MREAQINAKVRQALNYAAVGGLRKALFADTLDEDADMMLEFMPEIPSSQKEVVKSAIARWQEDFNYLRHLPDKVKE